MIRISYLVPMGRREPAPSSSRNLILNGMVNGFSIIFLFLVISSWNRLLTHLLLQFLICHRKLFEGWNLVCAEIFEFDAMADPPSVLNVEVFDFDGPFDEAVSLGHAEINFVRSNISDLADVWIPLQGKLAQACQSKLHLRIFLDHTGSGDAVRDYLNKMEKEVGKKVCGYYYFFLSQSTLKLLLLVCVLIWSMEISD